MSKMDERSCGCCTTRASPTTVVFGLRRRITQGLSMSVTKAKGGGFERCPRCGCMWGPTEACSKCGWSKACGWCDRVYVPGRGWTRKVKHGIESHGMCPECAIRYCGKEVQTKETPEELISIAAHRLGVHKWQVLVKFWTSVDRQKKMLLLTDKAGKIGLRRMLRNVLQP